MSEDPSADSESKAATRTPSINGGRAETPGAKLPDESARRPTSGSAANRDIAANAAAANADRGPTVGAASAADGVAPPPLLTLGPAPAPLEGGDPFSVAGRKAMWLHVQRLLAREAAIRDPAETDALRRYRVATRRLRSALRFFRTAYGPRETRVLRSGLADLADALGRVRDLDVRIEHLDRWSRERGDLAPADIEPLIFAWGRERNEAAGALVRELDSRGHRRLLERLIAFVETASPQAPQEDRPVRLTRDRAASSIWSAFENVRAYGPIIAWADLPTLHALRVDAKRLRYAIEFLAPVLGPRHDLLVERLVDLQDHLGALNDAATTADAIRAWLRDGHVMLSAGQRAAVAAYLVQREREAARLRRGVGRTWRPIAGIAFARRLGSAVAVAPAG